MHFGTNGIRKTFDSISPSFIAEMTAAFATWVNKPKVLVTRDTRTTGELVEGAVVSGLLWAGVQPILGGILPTPASEYLAMKRNIPYIVITSSHNPPNWVALKFGDREGLPLSKETGLEIEEIYNSKSWKTTSWDNIPPVLHDDNLVYEYMNMVKSQGKPLNGVKLVIDCGNGTASSIAPYIFRELGAHVITLNCQMDGHFPGRPSEPTPDTLKDLAKTVVSVGAYAGIAYDGDADRLALVDEKGRVLRGDQSFSIGIDIALSQGEGDVATTVASGNVIRDMALKHGRKVKYLKVGSPYIMAEMEKGGYAVGGEESGGIAWMIKEGDRKFPVKDGILSSVKILSHLVSSNLKLSEIVDALPSYVFLKDKVPMGSERFEKIKSLQERFKDDPNAVVLDGVRINYESGWILIRPSGTENYMRVMVEGNTPEEANQLMDKAKSLLSQI